MDFIHYSNKIVLHGENGAVIAEVIFPEVYKDTVDVKRTFVDDSLRGQGVAGKLMQEVAADLEDTGRKAKLSCTYAISWFKKHPELHDLLVNKEQKEG
ncbi:MAG: N-acetyltransferase [Clostridiales bacterium]|nr:N-acetyltransferase [Clostridiales bacterium]